MITGADFKDAVLVLAGNIFIVILIVRAIGCWTKKEWGELIAHLVLAVVIAGMIYATDLFINVLKAFATAIFGAGQ